MGVKDTTQFQSGVENYYSIPNVITALRTVACLIIFSIAYSTKDMRLNLVGLSIYWILDCLDGFLARRLGQETIVGAQFDILSDRILISYFYFTYLSMNEGPILVVTLFLFNFLVLDHYLSNQYLRWPIISPNYFYEVDRTVWLLNWSPLGKLINTGPVTLLLLVSDTYVAPLLIMFLILAYKGYSLWRLSRLPAEHNVDASKEEY